MHQTKIITLLKLLSPPQIRKLELYLSKQLTNARNQFTLPLLKILKRLHPNFPKNRMETEQIQKRLAKATKEKVETIQGQWNNTTSFLSAITEEFIGLLEIQQSTSFRKQLLLKVLNRNGVYRLLPGEIRRENLRLNRDLEEDIENYYHLYYIHKMLYFHPNFDKSKATLETLEKQLDLFYTIQKLKIYFEKFVRVRVFEEDYNLEAFNIFLETVHKTSAIKENPLIELYLLVTELYDEFNFEKFIRFKTLIFELKTLSKNERYTLVEFIINRAMLEAQSGNYSLVRPLYEIYQNGVEKQLFIKETFLQTGYFINIVSLAINLKDTTYLKQFLKAHAALVALDIKNDITTISDVILLFVEKKWEAALPILHQLRSKRSLPLGMRIFIRRLQIKTMYMKSKQDKTNSDLDKTLDAFKTYVRRRNFPKPRMQAYYNFTKYINCLRDANCKQERQELIDNIFKIPIIERFWLLEQLGEALKF